MLISRETFDETCKKSQNLLEEVSNFFIPDFKDFRDISE